MEVAVLHEDLLNKASVEHGGHNVMQHPRHLIRLNLLRIQPLVQNVQHFPTKVHIQDWQYPLSHPAPASGNTLALDFPLIAITWFNLSLWLPFLCEFPVSTFRPHGS